MHSTMHCNLQSGHSGPSIEQRAALAPRQPYMDELSSAGRPQWASVGRPVISHRVLCIPRYRRAASANDAALVSPSERRPAQVRMDRSWARHVAFGKFATRNSLPLRVRRTAADGLRTASGKRSFSCAMPSRRTSGSSLPKAVCRSLSTDSSARPPTSRPPILSIKEAKRTVAARQGSRRGVHPQSRGHARPSSIAPLVNQQRGVPGPPPRGRV
jgi:hypothetical protein